MPTVLVPFLLACLIPLLSGCSRSAPATVGGELARFDFEDGTWAGMAASTREEAHGGLAACRLAAAGYRSASAWSPHVDVRGPGTLRCSLWSRLARLDGGALTVYVHVYTGEPSEHPAIPVVPGRRGRDELFVIDAVEDEWTHHVGEVQLPADATSVRVELQLRTGRRVEGVLFVDDVVLEGGTT